MQKQSNIFMNKEKGFTLYVSVVISSVVLLGAYAISNTLIRQQLFSTDYLNSQKAFAIAESGIQCARAYDINLDAFSVDDAYTESIKCGDDDMVHNATPLVARAGTAEIGGARYSVFEVRSGDSCALVTVNKDPGIPNVVIEIESLGFNVCDPSGSRRVQRAVRSRY